MVPAPPILIPSPAPYSPAVSRLRKAEAGSQNEELLTPCSFGLDLPTLAGCGRAHMFATDRLRAQPRRISLQVGQGADGGTLSKSGLPEKSLTACAYAI
jgi:hypothetical protein